MELVKLEQNTEEWLDWRKSGYSASEAPAVMGESKYFPKTPYQLYLVHTGQKEVVYTKVMADGHKYEERALELAQEHLGENLEHGVCAKRGNFLASFDGLSESGVVVEVKTTSHGSDLWENGKSIYKWQLTHQAIVANTESVLLCVYAKDKDIIQITEVEIDPKWKEELIAAWEQFGDAMENFEAPALTKKDYVENESEQWLEQAKLYNELKEQKAAIEEQLKQVKNYLIEQAEGQPTKGGGVTVYPVTRKGNVQYKKIPELEGVDLDQYRGKSTTFWGIK